MTEKEKQALANLAESARALSVEASKLIYERTHGSVTIGRLSQFIDQQNALIRTMREWGEAEAADGSWSLLFTGQRSCPRCDHDEDFDDFFLCASCGEPSNDAGLIFEDENNVCQDCTERAKAAGAITERKCCGEYWSATDSCDCEEGDR